MSLTTGPFKLDWGPIRAVGNESDCRSRDRKFDRALYPTFVEIDHEIISSHSPSTDSRRVVVSYKQKYVHDILVNPLVKLAQEKVWLGELTIST